MLWHSSTTRCNFRTKRAAKSRTGSITIWSLLVMIIGLAMMMLVVNWTYLVLVNRHTLRLTDILATSAVEELLDEGRLADLPIAQADDVTASQNVILDPNTGLLKRNNDGAGASLRPKYTGNAADNEVLVTAGRIDQASQAVGVGNPFATSGSLLNTLRVEVLRKKAGTNPVMLLLRGFGSPDAANISSASFASLDSRVIGFRPRASVNAPVIPLAILNSSWQSGRSIPGNFGRMQLDVFLDPVKTTAPAETINGTLVSLKTGGGFSQSTALAQMTSGVVTSDLTGGFLGPVYAGSSPLSLNGTQSTPGNASAMAAQLNLIAASNRPSRAFPLYSSFSGSSADIVGFVGARVVAAAVENQGNGDRLRVRLEPAFLVHNTVETGVGTNPAPVPENIYIHKIRLTR